MEAGFKMTPTMVSTIRTVGKSTIQGASACFGVEIGNHLRQFPQPAIYHNIGEEAGHNNTGLTFR